MERLVRVARKLRTEHKFNGYIHLKTIPGCSEELTRDAATYADRVSVNIEMPTEASLNRFAPEKNHQEIIRPMAYLSEQIKATVEDKKMISSTPTFAPAGQSTQMVVGASNENDLQIMRVADSLYKKYNLKRVYYSGYVPISDDNRLPVLGTAVPLIRENRLYQADWLMRFYQFSIDEIINPLQPNLELDIDPKLAWALRNLHCFPIDINKAEYRLILRVPGIGISSAVKIVKARKFRQLGWDELRRFGIAVSRAKHFIVCSTNGKMPRDIDPIVLRSGILGQSKYAKTITPQQSLFE